MGALIEGGALLAFSNGFRKVLSYLRQVNFKIFLTFIFPYAGLKIMGKYTSSGILSRPQKTILWIMVYYSTIFYLKSLEKYGFFHWLGAWTLMFLSVFLEGFTLCYQYQIYRNGLLNDDFLACMPLIVHMFCSIVVGDIGYWSGTSQG